MRILLDTTVLIHLLKGDSAAIARIDKLKNEGNLLYTTTVNIYEYLKGIETLNTSAKIRNRNALKVLLSGLTVMVIDILASEKSAEIYANLRKKGITIDEGDYLIAGTALSNGIFTIVTRNEKHFGKIDEIEVLTY
ncbi:type II toxin-antitoxin system VapC family toxin [Candidatus Micrarchaeota archaeon]|nr:type II toxin-antitoxin system VapC family toxin [Candidatus Micrarchaeota archaeon]